MSTRAAGSPRPEPGSADDDLAAQLAERLAVRLSPELSRLALTHRSYAYENGGLPTNERLEFLGDSVLGLAVTDRLYRENPEQPEGRLASWRAAVVNSRALAAVARELDLGSLLLLGRGEGSTGGRDKDSILADSVEAVLGAVYLERGVAVAMELVHRMLADRIDQVVKPGFTGDFKTALQEHVAASGAAGVRYEATDEGPDHAKTFMVDVVMDGQVLGRGSGRTKKAAEQEAAASACRSLGLAVDSPV